MDIETHVEFTDCMEMVVIEIPKLPEDINSITDERQLWVMLLRITTGGQLKMLLEKNPKLAPTIDRLERISTNTEFVHQAIVREKTLRDHHSSLLTAERRGEEKGEYNKSIEITKNLLLNGIDINVISSSTGLTIEQIEEIKSQL